MTLDAFGMLPPLQSVVSEFNFLNSSTDGGNTLEPIAREYGAIFSCAVADQYGNLFFVVRKNTRTKRLKPFHFQRILYFKLSPAFHIETKKELLSLQLPPVSALIFDQPYLYLCGSTKITLIKYEP